MPTSSAIATPTAHLIGPGKLKVHNTRLAFTTGKGTPQRLDATKLQTLICYGNVGITDDAFAALFRGEVEVAWLSYHGNKFRGRLTRVVDRAALLRRAQHQASEIPQRRLHLARKLVADKIRSQIQAARHHQRHGIAASSAFLKSSAIMLQRVEQVEAMDELRGLEGITSKAWFQLFGHVLARPWEFPGRVRRPPTDPVNALLSLGYTLLMNKTVAMLQAVGLEINIGFLHDFRPGRPSLACDMIEPLRIPAVDRWVAKTCNSRQFTPGDFCPSKRGGVGLKPEKFSVALSSWETCWLKCNGRKLLQGEIDRLCRSLRKLASTLARHVTDGQ